MHFLALLRRAISLLLILTLLFPIPSFAQTAYVAPSFVDLSSTAITARLRGAAYDAAQDRFYFYADKGLYGREREAYDYFLTGLALPNDVFWVNLRPDEPNRIIDPLLEKTALGKVMLEADLQLKKRYCRAFIAGQPDR